MIDSYEFGRIVIDGQAFGSDVIVYPDRVEANWWRQQGHRLQVVDVQQVFEAEPDVLVVGTGAYGQMVVAEEVERKAAEAGVRLIAEPTERACKRYNELVGTAGRVVAALHLTC